MIAQQPHPAPGVDAKIQLLVVEDNPADRRLIEEVLRGSQTEVAAVETLAEAESRLRAGGLDLVLLDLGLPDSQGLDGLGRVLTIAAGIPVVVMTGLDDDTVGFDALSIGAEDFIQKTWLADPVFMQRTLRFALERHRLRQRLLQAEQERETVAMGRIGADASRFKISAGALGLRPLRESDPALFGDICDAYGSVLAAAAERQIYRVQPPVSEPLRALAERLGFVRASPRDLIDLHSAALARLTESAGSGHERLLTSEGRITILELMGYLASYYRRYYVSSMGIRGTAEQ